MRLLPIKIIVTLFAVFLFSNISTAQITNDSIVSDEEIERWLDTYAKPIKKVLPQDSIKAGIVKPVLSSTPDISIVEKNNPDPAKTNVVKNQSVAKTKKPSNVRQQKPKPKSNKNTSIEITAKTLITAKDSAEIRKQALAKSIYNPMFLDWVIGDFDAVSLSLSADDSVTVALRSGARQYVRSTAPELYSYHIEHLPKAADIKNKQLKNISPDNLLLRYDALNKVKSEDINIDFPNRPKWTKGARFQLHASQSYISPNWYKGGESNLAGNLYVLGYYNYNNYKNLQWDNKVEWKLGMNSAGSDSLRMFRVNEDLFRINSKLGLKAFSSFFYTAEVDVQTSFFNTYKSNTYVRTSGPFSPIRMNISAGIDYKYKSELSVFLSPISYKLIYVADTKTHESVSSAENIPNQVGITDGGRMLNQLGALLRVGWKHDFNESIGMEVNFSIFGNYVGNKKGVETDLEVIGNFIINRYLSAKVTLNPRYDSTVVPSDGGKAKMQFKELISLGFNYKI